MSSQARAIHLKHGRSSGNVGVGITGEASKSGLRLGCIGVKLAAAIVDGGAQLFGLKGLRGPGRTGSQSRGDGSLQIAKAFVEPSKLSELALGVIKIDPRKCGLEPHILRGNCKIGFGDADVGLRASALSASLGGVGEYCSTPIRAIVMLSPFNVNAGGPDMGKFSMPTDKVGSGS